MVHIYGNLRKLKYHVSIPPTCCQTVMKIIAKFFSFSLDRIYIYFDKFLLRRTRNLRLIPSIYRRKGGKKSYAEWAHVIGIFQTIFCQNLKSENNVVFDIGCGTGLLGIAAEPHVNEGGKYIGIDVSARDIGFCKRHFKQENFISAAELCDSILKQPKSEAERCFAEQFKSRCLRKSGRKATPLKRFQPVTTELTLANEECSVEQLVSSQIVGTVGRECYFVENWLFNACFGLTFWEVVFKPVRGAFTQPFQRRPHDLYNPSFSHLRMAEIDQALALIHSSAWQPQLQQRWTDKFGISNPFVGWHEEGWHKEGWPVLSQAIARIPPTHWQLIFSRMLADLRENCAGFPDLIH